MTWDDPYRLPRTARPVRYDLTLTPDLGTATFTGRVTIDVEVVEPVDELVLNSLDLEITASTLDGQDVPIRLEPDTQRLVVTAAPTIPAGHVELSFEFAGRLNDLLRGFYRSTYHDASGTERVIATTQMQSTDCRRAFPCFDEPDLKAVFGITLIVDEDLLAISNSPEIARRRIDGDAGSPAKVAVTFADTMPMSTYLVAFVVGPLEATEPIDVGGTPLRIIHLPGKGHLTAFGLEAARFSLSWFQEYYDIPYPGEKIDLVALPDFAAGAMENLGCITFRESLLLVDPATSTQLEQQHVADVVAHELAHMWFGDLVTMWWWNGIWLNEAFATFMEIAAVDEMRPDWRRWISFGLERSAAFDTDALASTRPVEYEVRSPADSEGMFDILTYQKGGALLRMLQQYLGEEPFRAGVSHYLRTHAYSNTETADLWDAIEEVSGQPARRLMDSWIWQRGFPIVNASLDGADLVLRQWRFGYSDEVRADPTTWVVPVHVRVGAETHRLLLDGPELRLTLDHPEQVVVVNAEGHGFYRVGYDDELRRRVLGAGLAQMSTIERYNLVDDAWNAVVAGDLDAPSFLDLARSFSGERELAVWQVLVTGLRGCARLVDDSFEERLRHLVVQLCRPALDELGWEPVAGEDDLTAKLRGLLVTTAGAFGADPEVRRRCRDLLEANESAPGSIHPELVAAATTVVAANGGVDEYEAFLARYRSAPTPQDQLRNLYALAEFDDAALIRRTAELALSGEVRAQNAPYLLNRCIANRHHGGEAWRLVRQHWADANATFPSSSIVRMVEPVKLLCTPEAAADAQAFFAEHPIRQAVATLNQILERQQVNVALRAREEKNLQIALS